MVKVIKRGEYSTLKKIDEFCCPCCGCVYKSDEWHVYFEDSKRYRTVECPWCKEIARVPYRDEEEDKNHD